KYGVWSLESRLQVKSSAFRFGVSPSGGANLKAKLQTLFGGKNKMKQYRLLILFVVMVAATSATIAQNAESARRTLDIYYIDVEGGAATLIVTPAGESILVDAGWPGFEGRDAKRIEQAMKAAGITAIDHLITTHYHTDHYGGVPELAKRVKVNRFYDHG